MINAWPDKNLLHVSFEIDEKSKTELIDEVTDYMDTLKVEQKEDSSGVLELLEAFHIELRYARQERIDGFTLPIIEAFCTMQAFAGLIHGGIPMPQACERRKRQINELTDKTDQMFSQVMGQRKYDDILKRQHDPVNYVYVQYLDYSYEMLRKSIPMDAGAPLLAVFFEESLGNGDEPADFNEYGVLSFPAFRRRCREWMRKNNYSDICLEEIIDDSLFTQADNCQ